MKAAVFREHSGNSNLCLVKPAHNHLVIRSKLPTCAAATVNLADAMISDTMMLVRAAGTRYRGVRSGRRVD
jgi:hypothetical protein